MQFASDWSSPRLWAASREGWGSDNPWAIVRISLHFSPWINIFSGEISLLWTSKAELKVERATLPSMKPETRVELGESGLSVALALVKKEGKCSQWKQFSTHEFPRFLAVFHRVGLMVSCTLVSFLVRSHRSPWGQIPTSCGSQSRQAKLATLRWWDVSGFAHMSTPHFISGGLVWEADK